MVPMPETAMNENDLRQSRKYEVRRSWKVSAVEAKAKSQLVHKSPNGHFRLGILAFDPPHQS
jgi:hypothetical protein